MPTKTWAVVVMPRERRSQILEELHSLGIEAYGASTCHEARELLERRPRVELVISDLSLADGNWCDVFRHLIDSGLHAAMVVTTRNADERLWSEVLWRGAHDLLVEPYEAGDLRRVVEGAVRAVQSTAIRTAPVQSTSAETIETAAAVAS